MADIDSQNYLHQLEESKGGKISYRCFSLYYLDSKGIEREHGVFMYQIGKTLYYEDYMFKRSLLGIDLNKKALDEYVKFENSIEIDNITKILSVSKKKAKAFVSNTSKGIKKANIFDQLFGKILVMVQTKDGFTMFLDLPKQDFKNNIEKAQKEKK